MTISVWIIVFVILAFGFWIYFKKNKHIIENKGKKSNKTNKEYKLNRLDKMIENLAKEQELEDIYDNTNQNIEESLKDDENQKNTSVNKNEIIKNSIILERRKKK